VGPIGQCGEVQSVASVGKQMAILYLYTYWPVTVLTELLWLVYTEQLSHPVTKDKYMFGLLYAQQRTHFIKGKGKGKAIPLQSWTGP
jgi:hypothetical protein